MSDHTEPHRWDLVDAVGRSPDLRRRELPGGLELPHVEMSLLRHRHLSARERERLVESVRELERVYRELEERTGPA